MVSRVQQARPEAPCAGKSRGPRQLGCTGQHQPSCLLKVHAASPWAGTGPLCNDTGTGVLASFPAMAAARAIENFPDGPFLGTAFCIFFTPGAGLLWVIH